MGFFRRGRAGDHAPARSAPPAQTGEGDTPQALRRSMDDLVSFVNRNAGRLPGVAVVNTRLVLDTLRETIETSEVRPLDVYAVLAVRGTLNDYLPTTLRNYLAVDTALVDTPIGAGRSPSQLLMEQLDTLQTSASATLLAVHGQDANALLTQGSFLRTKFSGSDLDL